MRFGRVRLSARTADGGAAQMNRHLVPKKGGERLYAARTLAFHNAVSKGAAPTAPMCLCDVRACKATLAHLAIRHVGAVDLRVDTWKSNSAALTLPPK